MTDLYNVEGKIIPRRVNGVLSISNESELVTQTLRETEEMYNETNQISNGKVLTIYNIFQN